MATRIWTGTGDEGDTSLADGSRVRKDDVRVEAYGTLDEAACAIGLARVAVTDPPLDLLLAFAQQRLLNLASLLAAAPATADGPRVDDTDVVALERATDDLMDAAGGFGGFTLPGGGEAAARLHVARAVVRRAERRALTLSAFAGIDPTALLCLNRLSDSLFAAARYANHLDGASENAWDPGFEAPPR